MGREWSLDMGYDNMKFNNGKGMKSRYGILKYGVQVLVSRAGVKHEALHLKMLQS